MYGFTHQLQHFHRPDLPLADVVQIFKIAQEMDRTCLIVQEVPETLLKDFDTVP